MLTVNVSAKLIASLSERNLPLYPIYMPRQDLGFIFAKLYFATYYVFCCVEYIVFVLCISFSFTLQTKEKETHPKKKKTLAVFLRPSGVQTKWMSFSIALQLKNRFSLANLHFVLQTKLGFVYCERQT